MSLDVSLFILHERILGDKASAPPKKRPNFAIEIECFSTKAIMESLVTDGKLLLKEYGKIKVLCNLDLSKSKMTVYKIS